MPVALLVYCLAGHGFHLTHAHMTQDENYVVTASDDTTISVWDIRKGTEVLTIENCFGEEGGSHMSNMFLCCEDKYIVAIDSYNDDVIFVFNTKTGQQKLQLIIEEDDNHKGVETIFANKTHLALAICNKIHVYDVEQNKFDCEHIQADKWEEFDSSFILLSGAQNILCAGIENGRFLWIFDVLAKKELHCIEIKEKSSEEQEWFLNTVAVTPDAKRVLTASISDAHIFDVHSGQKLHLFEGFEYGMEHGMFITDTTFAGSSGVDEYEVVLLDVEQQKLTNLLKLEEPLAKVLATKDVKTFVTIVQDPVVRVWKPKLNDLDQSEPVVDSSVSRKENEKEYVSDLMALSGNARYVLLNSVSGPTCIRVCDVYSGATMRTIYFSSKSLTIKPISEKQAVLCDENFKLHLFHLDEMYIEKTLQGFSGSSSFFIRNNAQNREVVSLTKFRSNLKLTSLASGQTTAVIKTGAKKRLKEEFLVSANGSTAVVEEAGGKKCWMVISLESKQVLHKLARPEGKLDWKEEEFLTYDGHYFVHRVFTEPPQVPEWQTTYVLVWDLKQGKLVQTIYDKEHEAIKKCVKTKKKNNQLESLDMETIYVINQDVPKVVAASADQMIKVYDLVTGNLEYTLKDHHAKGISKLMLATDTTDEKAKHLVSVSKNDYVLWVFDTETWSKVACFKADYFWEKFVMVDNYTIVGVDAESSYDGHLNVLKLHRGADSQPIADPPVLFTENDTPVHIDIPEADKNVPEPGDPDTDTEKRKAEPQK